VLIAVERDVQRVSMARSRSGAAESDLDLPAWRGGKRWKRCGLTDASRWAFSERTARIISIST